MCRDQTRLQSANAFCRNRCRTAAFEGELAPAERLPVAAECFEQSCDLFEGLGVRIASTPFADNHLLTEGIELP